MDKKPNRALIPLLDAVVLAHKSAERLLEKGLAATMTQDDVKNTILSVLREARRGRVSV